MKPIAILGAALFFAPAFAQELPVPKMLKDVEGQKGRWRMEMLESSGRPRARGMTITVCTDNLMDQARRDKAKASGCKHKLVKDTDDEAVVESECKEKERTTTLTLKRDGKSILMTMERTDPKGPQSMKMRATHVGPCREELPR
jgi:hypothetical protein